ncbi:MAG: hypothetical protein V4696_03705 [Pseudomonadota bacterium]
MKFRTKLQGQGMAKVVIPHLRRASHEATDRAIQDAKTRTRTTIRGVGLGRLDNAIGATSSLKKRRTNGRAWGAIFARGGIYSRANQALMSYTEGATILPTGGRKWLAYPTKAAGRLTRLPIPRVGGRGYANFKNQPSRGRNRLKFVRFSVNRAALVLENATVSNKTGRAKPMGKRLGRGARREKFVIMFWLIKFTRRAARFNQHAIVADAGARIGVYVEEFQRRNPVA